MSCEKWAMPVQKSLSTPFTVNARVSYVPEESNPETNYYFFSYKISIKNNSSIPAQLMSRHWIITNGLGEIEEVRGAGVVGMQPKINPGQTFEYESVCPLSTSSGSMSGSYQMVSDDGTQFEITIPEFFLISPSALH